MRNFVPFADLAEVQLALLELQSDMFLNSSPDVDRADCLSMWKAISAFPSYAVVCNVAKRVLSMFGTTYRCEAAFSEMKAIKSKERNRITNANIEHCVRAVTTKYEPQFSRLVHDMQCHGSH